MIQPLRPHRSTLTMTRATRPALFVLLAAVILGPAPDRALGQAETRKPTPRAPALKFEDVTLTTKDGVHLRCTYYHGAETKQTVPLILLHDWGGGRGQLRPLALYLQQFRHAVIVPDLRGHGNSVQVEGLTEPIDYTKLRRPQIEATILDVEAVKSFLLKENNQGKLNIEQLGVLGTGFGGTLALTWSVRDWRAPSLRTYKMGQDVKALILVSPLRSFQGITVNDVLKDQLVLGNLATLIVAGKEDSRRLSDAERVQKAFERAWGERSKEGVMLYAAATSLQGVELITAPGMDVGKWIAAFIDQQLVRRADRFPWTDRTNPLQ